MPELTREEMESRRFEALRLFQSGWSQAQVARQLKVSRTTASRWAGQIAAGGSLQRTIATGRPSHLTADQVAQLPELYAALQREGKRPTSREYRDAIWHRFGVWYHPDHLFRILSRWQLEQGVQRRPRVKEESRDAA